MKGIFKRLAFILTFIFITESVMGSTDFSDLGNSTLFESLLDNGENKAAADKFMGNDTTASGSALIKGDSIESGAGVIAGLLDLIYDLKRQIIKDGVVSSSAIDYEIPEIPKYLNKLLNRSYSDLTDTDRFYLTNYLNVRQDTMEICQKYGLDVRGSIPYALIMQTFDTDFDTARAMVVSNASESKAVEYAEEFGELFLDYDVFYSEEGEILKQDFIDCAVVGYRAEEVINAYIFANMAGEELSNVIYDKNNISEVKENEKALPYEYKEAAEKYSVNSWAVKAYIMSGGSIEGIDEEFENMKDMLKNGSGISLYSSSSPSFEVGYDSAFKTGALSYVEGINDNVDPSTGALYYSENICSIPGANGLDFNLTLNYSSNSTNTAKYIDNRINKASNWRYNIPYLTDKDGEPPKDSPRYVTLADGSTYTLMPEGNGYKAIECFNDELTLVKDTKKAGGTNSAFKLTYKNGNTEYFNADGQWLSTYNRFGDCIRVIEDVPSTRIVIEDTMGRRITVKAESNGSTTDSVHTITLPDQTTKKLYYSTQRYGSAYNKTLLTKIVDQLGNETKFEYTVGNGIKADSTVSEVYKNALLTKVTTPTGLENHYNYEWTSKLKTYLQYNVDVDEREETETKPGEIIVTEYYTYEFKYEDNRYPRISGKYKKMDSVEYDNTSYTYNGSFMVSQAYMYNVCTCYDECDCIPYYNETLKKWKDSCGGSGCMLSDNTAYEYTTTVKNGNRSYVYTFNQLDLNIRTEEKINNTTAATTEYSYLFSNRRCSKPGIVTYTENGMKRIENYEYTDLWDIKRQRITDGTGKELSNISYSYDYESNSSEYYGFCLNTTVKMNSSTSIVQTAQLMDTYPYVNKDIGELTVKRNGVEETNESYSRSQEYGNRITTVRSKALDESDDSILWTATHYYYEDDIASPTEREYQVATGGTSAISTYSELYTYDINERITSVKSTGDYLAKYKYDAIGSVTEVEYIKSQTSPSGAVLNPSLGSDKVKISYNYKQNTITATNENGKVTVYDYDPIGNKSSVKSLSDGTTGAKDIVLESYTYDSKFRPSVVVTGKAKTVYTYDDRDRPLTVIVKDKDNNTVLSNETYSYVNNSTGLQTTQTIKGDTTAPDVVTVTQQDAMGRSISVKKGSATTSYTYDMAGNVVKETGVNTKTYEYDSKGNVLKTTQTTGSSTITTSATYDMFGNIITSTDAKGNKTTYAYTGLNWLKQVTAPFGDGKTTSTYYGYDMSGNKTYEGVDIDASNKRTVSYQYDHRNRVTRTTKGNEVTIYAYDGVGNKIEMTQLNSGNGDDKTTLYEYDRLNRNIKYTDGMGNTESYKYDDYGNLISKTTRNGQSINYTYDALGRCLSENNNKFTYNLAGGIKTSSNGNVSQSYTYNSLGLIAAENTNTAGGYSIERAYDIWGRNTKNVYKKGTSTYKTQTYTYDGLSRLTSISSTGDNSSAYKASYTYDNNSNVTKITDGSVTKTYEYNASNLLTRVNNDSAGSNNDTRFTYTYSLDGNVKNMTDIKGSVTSYTYDSSNRLTKETVTGSSGVNFTSVYGYDSFGNRSNMSYTENGALKYNVSYEYDMNNRLTKELKTSSASNGYTNVTEYSYDKNGNTLSKVWYNKNADNSYEMFVNDFNSDNSVGYEVYTYDELNELTSLQNSRGNSASYTYLPSHYRMSKNVNGSVTYHIWDGENIAAESNGTSTVRSYVWGSQLLTDEDRRTYMYDGHGNMVQQVKSGAVENKTRYDAYGNVVEGSNVNDTPFGYCGEYTDSESGLVYLRNRYYDSTSGRFINEDPVKNSTNWYSYCSGNPVVYFDKFGLEYNTLRNFASDLEKTLDTKVSISTYKGKVTVKMADNGYNYSGTFNYDGTAVIDGKSKKIAENRDGHLYMERTDFYDVMGIENEQYDAPVEEYTNRNAFWDTLVNWCTSSAINAFCGVVKMGGTAVSVISSYDDFLSKTSEKNKPKTVGSYYDESVVGEVYNSETNKYEAICTYTTYQLATDIEQTNRWIFFVSYTENFGLAYQTSMFEEDMIW